MHFVFTFFLNFFFRVGTGSHVPQTHTVKNGIEVPRWLKKVLNCDPHAYTSPVQGLQVLTDTPSRDDYHTI